MVEKWECRQVLLHLITMVEAEFFQVLVLKVVHQIHQLQVAQVLPLEVLEALEVLLGLQEMLLMATLLR